MDIDRAEYHAASLVAQVDTSNQLASRSEIIARATRWLQNLKQSPQARTEAAHIEQWLRDQSMQLYGMDLLDPPLSQQLHQDVTDISAFLYLLEERNPNTNVPIRDVGDALDSIEPNFAPTLLARIRQREATEPDFATELERARQSARQVATALEPDQAEVAADIADEVAQGDGDNTPVPVFVSTSSEQGETGVLIFTLLVLTFLAIAAFTKDKPSDDGDE